MSLVHEGNVTGMCILPTLNQAETPLLPFLPPFHLTLFYKGPPPLLPGPCLLRITLTSYPISLPVYILLSFLPVSFTSPSIRYSGIAYSTPHSLLVFLQVLSLSCVFYSLARISYLSPSRHFSTWRDWDPAS